MQNKITHKRDGVLNYLIFLTVFFILFEVSFFIQTNAAYIDDFTNAHGSFSIPLTIIPGVLFFIFAQLSLHALYCLSVWFCSEQIFKAHSWFQKHKLATAVTIWFLGVWAILFCNQYFFPNSKYAHLLSVIISNPNTIKVFAAAFSTISIAILLFSISSLIKKLILEKPAILLASMSVIAIVSITAYESSITTPVKPQTSKPNIIIVGIDSLRPDFMSKNGGVANTPYLDSVANESTVFTNALTPIARTFPSWTSILLGAYPKETGIRFNLAEIRSTDLSRSLPAIFKKQGYRTIFATDETRFSNIDNKFGFDDVISPPMGLNDFILGSLNDFPLSNLLINTRLGAWIFPYSYANRAAVKTYEPSTFVRSLSSAIKNTSDNPLFMVVHFCLPHFPYIWASLPAKKYTIRERYIQSVNRTDQQVAHFMKKLDQENLLQNAIVIFLSDHGEALELPGDRLTETKNYVEFKSKHLLPPKFYPPSVADEGINQSAGHGTDVLSLSQYHTFLAFKLYGQKQYVGKIKGPVSLVELKESILALTKPVNNNAIANAIKGKQLKLARKHIFIESDYSPASIRTIYPNIHKVLLEGLNLYRIHPKTQRLTVKPSMGYKFIHSRQYADIYGKWILALYPKDSRSMVPVLMNMETGEWTTNLKSKFAQKSPQAEMLKALRNHYKEEVIYHRS